MNGNARALLDYHQRSKHRVDRYAPGPRALDWANQPDPFREYAGAARVRLPLAAASLDTRYNDVRAGALPPAHPFDLDSLAILFELSLGLSAWKAHGAARWALRCNPSSGNLHPTESYLLCPRVPGIPAGVHHYLSRDHVLEQRADVGDPRWSAAFAGRGVLVGLSSIHWREAWKYGMRAWRYCQHDGGHAVAALAYAAAALGWRIRALASPSDETVAKLLGLDRNADFEAAEAEVPDLLLWIGPGAPPDAEQLLSALHGADWHGRANRLSREHVAWPDIDRVQAATRKPGTRERAWPKSQSPGAPEAPAVDLAFAAIARQRRSAVAFDGSTRLTAPALFAMLECLLVRRDVPPWSALASPVRTHPALMLHRVDGLDAGLYLMVRDPAALPLLKQAMRAEWLWERVGPPHLPLYLLLPFDLREAAQLICCHQAIGADACLALGMLAHFDAARDEPWVYRELFRECGMLGQVLYLEAEAAGVRATGIGCFFDDEMHALLGINDDSWQSLYHFTVGGAVDDPRLSTLPPYESQP